MQWLWSWIFTMNTSLCCCFVPIFSTYARREEEAGIQSHVTNVAQCYDWSTTVNFKSVHQFIKHSSLRPSCYLHLKALALYFPFMLNWSGWKHSSPTLNYHDPPPFQPLYMGWHLLCEIGSPASPFSHVCWKKIREPANEATCTVHIWLHHVAKLWASFYAVYVCCIYSCTNLSCCGGVITTNEISGYNMSRSHTISAKSE